MAAFTRTRLALSHEILTTAFACYLLHEQKKFSDPCVYFTTDPTSRESEVELSKWREGKYVVACTSRGHSSLVDFYSVYVHLEKWCACSDVPWSCSILIVLVMEYVCLCSIIHADMPELVLECHWMAFWKDAITHARWRGLTFKRQRKAVLLFCCSDT